MNNDQYQIIYTQSALLDIEEKADYIALSLYEPALAKTRYAQLQADIEKNLSHFPHKYPFHPSKKWTDKGIRQCSFHNNIILYSIDEASKIVYIRSVSTKGRNISVYKYF